MIPSIENVHDANASSNLAKPAVWQVNQYLDTVHQAEKTDNERRNYDEAA
jgi:hypothetical protein